MNLRGKGKMEETRHIFKLLCMLCRYNYVGVFSGGALGHLAPFLFFVLLYLSVFPFWAPSPQLFKHSKIRRISWGLFRLSKNRFRIRAFKSQDLPMPPTTQAPLNSPIWVAPSPRILSDLPKNICKTTRTFSDLSKNSFGLSGPCHSF